MLGGHGGVFYRISEQRRLGRGPLGMKTASCRTLDECWKYGRTDCSFAAGGDVAVDNSRRWAAKAAKSQRHPAAELVTPRPTVYPRRLDTALAQRVRVDCITHKRRSIIFGFHLVYSFEYVLCILIFIHFLFIVLPWLSQLHQIKGTCPTSPTAPPRPSPFVTSLLHGPVDFTLCQCCRPRVANSHSDSQAGSRGNSKKNENKRLNKK